MSRMRVIVEKDRELCGIEDAIQFNSFGEQDNVEFNFEFEPSVTVNASDVLLLSLSSVANTLQSAATSGNLNDENLKNYVQQSTNSGTKQ